MLLNFKNKQDYATKEKIPAKKELLETGKKKIYKAHYCTNYSCRFQIPH